MVLARRAQFPLAGSEAPARHRWPHNDHWPHWCSNGRHRLRFVHVADAAAMVQVAGELCSIPSHDGNWRLVGQRPLYVDFACELLALLLPTAGRGGWWVSTSRTAEMGWQLCALYGTPRGGCPPICGAQHNNRASGSAGGPTARQTDRRLLRQPTGRAGGRTPRPAVGRQRRVRTGAARGGAPERFGPVHQERQWQAHAPRAQGAAPRHDTDVRSRRNAPGQRHGRRRPRCKQRRPLQRYLRLRRHSMGRQRRGPTRPQEQPP